MAPYSRTDLSVQDLVEKARVLRAQTFSRALTRAFRAIVPARADANPVPVQADLFEQSDLVHQTTYFLPLVRGVQSLVNSVIVGLRRNAMRRQLVGLDDRMLRDIGIRRDDIPHLVASAYADLNRSLGSVRTAAELYYLVPAAPQSSARGHDRLAA